VQNSKGSEETPEDAIKETGQVNEKNLGVSTEDLCLAAFAATESNTIFSRRQPHQDVKVLQHFRN
jgi:hypothetical protein